MDSLAHRPAIRPRYSRRSERVAEGRSSISASKSLLAFSSILGLEPGRFFGASVRGERAALLGQLGVGLYGGAAHPEGAGGLALGRTPTEGFDYLLPEVF